MNNKRQKIIFGIASAVIALVAIFFGFANAFSDTNGYNASRGNMFNVMFGQGTTNGYNAVPVMIAGFVFFLVAVFFILVSIFLPGKLGLIGFGLSALLLVAGGIMFFFTSTAWIAANRDLPYVAESIIAYPPVNGVGVYGMGISAIVSGVLCLYCARLASK